MLADTVVKSPENADCAPSPMETELTLGLPGGNRTAGDGGKVGTKRKYREAVDLSLGSTGVGSSDASGVAGEEVGRAEETPAAK